MQNEDNKHMFTIVNSLISPQKENIPYFSSIQEGCSRFSEHFTNKIELLLSKIDNTQHALSAETTLYIKTMDSFTHTNSINVLTLLKLTKKTCDLDPLPSTVLTECFDVLAPFITQIINMSISQGQVPSLLKEATVRPLLKKPSLDINILAHYRPVSNLTQLSKTLEKVIAQQLLIHTDHMSELYQSAYKPQHSTETALLCVCEDIKRAFDIKKRYSFNHA